MICHHDSLSLSLSLRDSASPLLIQSSSASSPRVLSVRQRPSPSQRVSLIVEASMALSTLDGDELTVVTRLLLSGFSVE
ncbi:hypothetical protein RchiOBHm_Chr6g0263641 [Rosa chinensis]|uniref:Uncharacterized protein n=1 Tax=Rosa chinensis TaxID=74649 RepID=A0A2P6PNZ4_ROSCH|nr:hypothetical protein RchiOBHm_Chr6g0263641 [Rosa chinensis]